MFLAVFVRFFFWLKALIRNPNGRVDDGCKPVGGDILWRRVAVGLTLTTVAIVIWPRKHMAQNHDKLNAITPNFWLQRN